MEFLKRLFRRWGAAGRRDESAYWVYVRCERCGEKLRTRIDLHNDLSAQYGQETTYITRKRLIGSQRCFQPVEIELIFDAGRVLIDRDINGGQFIDKEEYHGA
jgi:hypothetical protein